MATIKDTIHRYIDLDPFERRVIDSPWFQRLRRVKQNDVSSIVYPTMQATRFEHSLGAMHLAGRCLKAGLEPGDDDLPAFLTALREELKNVTGLPLADEKLRDFAVRIARLYGALHDIGHPPYSHLLESCHTLKQVCGVDDKEYEHKWHEYNGLQIVRAKLPTFLDPKDENAARLAAVGILNAKRPPGRALFAIKQLVDAVIDADRMDFVARDGKTSGSEFGTYDIDRLVESFRLFIVAAPKKSIFIRPSDKALSAIESLLQERYKIYRWVHYHHRVMQAKALMRFALRKLTKEMPATVFSFDHYIGSTGAPHAWAFLGDSYVDQQLERQLLALEATEKTLQPGEQRMLLVLRCLLRRNRLALPLWKRKEHYSLGHDSVESFVRQAFEAQPVRPRLHVAASTFGSLMNWLAAGLSRISARVEEIAAQLEVPTGDGDWFLIELVGQKTDRDEDTLVAGGERKRVVFLTEISTVAESIAQASLKDVYLFAFRLAPAEVPDEDRPRVLAEARQRLATKLVDAYYKTPGLAAILDGLLPKGAEEYGGDETA